MPTENKVSVKYITKKIKTDCPDVFLITTNHTRANTISSRNLRPTAKKLCCVWLSGFLIWPLKKIKRVIIEIIEKSKDKIAISLNRILNFFVETSKYPATSKSTFSGKSNETYL